MTTFKALTTTLLATTLLGAPGCVLDSEDELAESSMSSRRLFEGSELSAEFTADPEASALVDLRGATIYEFDQREAAIDFSRFEVYTPWDASPVAMLRFADEHGIDLERLHFELRSAEAERGEEFRFNYVECVELCGGTSDSECIDDCMRS